jgi:hypothetical protein
MTTEKAAREAVEIYGLVHQIDYNLAHPVDAHSVKVHNVTKQMLSKTCGPIEIGFNDDGRTL